MVLVTDRGEFGSKFQEAKGCVDLAGVGGLKSIENEPGGIERVEINEVEPAEETGSLTPSGFGHWTVSGVPIRLIYLQREGTERDLVDVGELEELKMEESEELEMEE